MTIQNTFKWSAVLFLTLSSSCNKDAETDTGNGVCTELAEGRWFMAGSVYGMSMDAILTLNDAGCSFTFSDWNMSMDVPDGGTIQGDAVTLDGNGTREWGDCEGIADDNSTIVGACSDGATFEMNFQ